MVKPTSSLMAGPEVSLNNCGHNLLSDVEPYFSDCISESNLKSISFNMHGYRQGKTFLESLLNHSNVDVVFIQEHWLSNNQLCKLTNIHDNYVGFATSAMEDRLNNDVLFGRPFGGVATLIKKSLITRVNCVLEDERCIILKLGSFLITNVYLPSYKINEVNDRAGRNTLLTLLESISEIFAKFHSCSLIMGGDFNCDVSKDGHGKSVFDFNALCVFQNKWKLCNSIDVINCNNKFTYVHDSLNHRSHIDFFLVSCDLSDVIVDYHVIESALNFSDHHPIALIIDAKLSSADCQLGKESQIKSRQKHYRWDHGDRGRYYELTREAMYSIDQILDNLLQNNSDDIPSAIENVYEMIVSCLKKCSDMSIPNIKSGSLKFWWDQELDELKSNSVMSFRAWQNAGKPRDGPIHEEMTKQRLRYRKAIKDKEYDSSLEISNDLHECLVKKDFRNFWNCLKNKCGGKSNLATNSIGLPSLVASHSFFHLHFVLC